MKSRLSIHVTPQWLCCTGTMFVFGTFGTCGTFGTFGTCLAPDCSEHLANIGQKSVPNRSKSAQNTKSQHVEIWGCQFLFWFRMVPSNTASGYVAKISTMSNVQCPMYNVQGPTYNVQCTMSNVRCPTYNVQRTMSNVRCPM